jgi:hypothetical protein
VQLALLFGGVFWTILAGLVLVTFRLIRFSEPLDLVIPLGLPVAFSLSAFICGAVRWRFGVIGFALLLFVVSALMLFSIGIIYMPVVLGILASIVFEEPS